MNQPRSARHVCCVLLHRKLNSRISFVQHHPRVVEIDSRVVLQGASSCTLLRFRVFVQITRDSDCPSWSGFDRRNHDWTGFTLVGFLYFVTAVKTAVVLEDPPPFARFRHVQHPSISAPIQGHPEGWLRQSRIWRENYGGFRQTVQAGQGHRPLRLIWQIRHPD